jgi:hypothetical protein
MEFRIEEKLKMSLLFGIRLQKNKHMKESKEKKRAKIMIILLLISISIREYFISYKKFK